MNKIVSKSKATLWFECLRAPKMHRLNPNHHSDGNRRWDFGRSLDHDGGSPINWISAFIKEAPERSSGPSKRCQIQWWHDLRLLSHQNSEKLMFIVCKPPVLQYFVRAIQMNENNYILTSTCHQGIKGLTQFCFSDGGPSNPLPCQPRTKANGWDWAFFCPVGCECSLFPFVSQVLLYSTSPQKQGQTLEDFPLPTLLKSNPFLSNSLTSKIFSFCLPSQTQLASFSQ